CDWPLDDFAARLGHQATHAGELTYLLPVAARSGINHQIHWIQFFTALIVLQGPKHHTGNFVASMGPDVDDLVVTLAVGYDAFSILLLNLTNLLIGVFQLGLFLFWNDHVRNSN